MTPCHDTCCQTTVILMVSSALPATDSVMISVVGVVVSGVSGALPSTIVTGFDSVMWCWIRLEKKTYLIIFNEIWLDWADW